MTCGFRKLLRRPIPHEVDFPLLLLGKTLTPSQPAWSVPEVALSRPWLEPALRLPYPVPGLNRPWGCLIPTLAWTVPDVALFHPCLLSTLPSPLSSPSCALNFPRKWRIKKVRNIVYFIRLIIYCSHWRASSLFSILRLLWQTIFPIPFPFFPQCGANVAAPYLFNLLTSLPLLAICFLAPIY